MTATDELRRLLDERGVEYTTSDGEHVKETCWPYMGELTAAFAEYDNGTTRFACDTWCFTPEQAVAATLGREPDDAAMVKLHDQMNATMLKYEIAQGIEKRDGDAAIVVPWVAKMHALLEEAAMMGREVTGETSDGYHTFNELYHHRAVLFSVIVRDHQELAWKSMRHHDGTMYDGMFIVGIETPEGQATYHYDIDPYWDMFDCKELDRAPEWDGHTPDDAIERIATLGAGTCRRIRGHRSYRTQGGYRIECSECGYGLADRHYRYCPNCGRRIVEVSE